MTDIERKPSAREKVLYTAAKLTVGDRDKTYGSPVNNMQNIATMWSAYLYCRFAGQTVDPLNVELTGEDVAHMMSLMKTARCTIPGAPHPDNYIDGACYTAIAAECADEERND